MKDKQGRKIRFGISTRLSIAIGFASVVIALIYFWIAMRLNKILTIATIMEKNWAIADELIDEDLESKMASILEKGREIYYSLPEEERADPTDRSYQSCYDVLPEPEYADVLERLNTSVHVPNIMWADLRIKDEESKRYVYLMHTGPKEDGTYPAGFWEDEDDRLDVAVESRNARDEDYEQMRYLPKWVNKIASLLPDPLSRVFSIADHLLLVDSRNIQNRFSVLYPVHSTDDGQIIGYLGIGEYYSNYKTYSLAFALVFAAVSIPYFIIIGFLARSYVNYSITGPIQELAKAAEEYGMDEEKEQHDDYFKKVRVHSNDEILLLRDSMSDMETSLKQYMTNVRQMTAKEERLKTEMDMSAQIQIGMLPKFLDNNGKERDFTIVASIKPAKAVGGDFYDFFEIDDDRVGIVMADVSGKGMPAALFMMISKIIVNISAKTEMSEEDIMSRANREICDNNPELLFVTVWFGIYHIKDRMIRYVNFGHDHPAVYRHREGKFSLDDNPSDMVMGLDPDTQFAAHTIQLEPKDKVFLYTDGIPEAHNADEEMYGNDRMLDALNRSAGLTQQAFLEAFDADVRSFIGEAEQFDDMTMLLLELN